MPISGHLSISKTLSKMEERFYWVNCLKDVGVSGALNAMLIKGGNFQAKMYSRKCVSCLASRHRTILYQQQSHGMIERFNRTLESQLACMASIIKRLGHHQGSRDGAVVRAPASHQCGPGSISGLGVICGLSLLLVLVLAPRVFLRVFRFSSLLKN